MPMATQVLTPLGLVVQLTALNEPVAGKLAMLTGEKVIPPLKLCITNGAPPLLPTIAQKDAPLNAAPQARENKIADCRNVGACVKK